MKYRYIILLGEKLNRSDGHMTPLPGKLPHAAEMICALESVAARVFISADAPTLASSGHGLVIGRVFTGSGPQVEPPIRFGGTGSDVGRFLMPNTWGASLAF